MASVESKNTTENGNSPPTNTVENIVIDQKDSQSLLPHLESLERIIKLPVVGAAWDKSQDVYGKVKGQNRVFNWALNAAEDCVARAVTTAAPIVYKLDRPIQYVDQTLVKGIDKLEVKAPIIKDTPQEIYNQAKSKVIDVVQPHLERVVKFKAAGQQKAASLKELAWHKANEVLATQYGTLAVHGVDTTTALAERLLEYYFPKAESDVEDDDNVPVSASEDPVLHTVQTVGRLSNKISRRVYRNVSRQIKQVQKGNINDYLSSLIAALKLHQYINFINSSMGTNVEQSTLSAECAYVPPTPAAMAAAAAAAAAAAITPTATPSAKSSMSCSSNRSASAATATPPSAAAPSKKSKPASNASSEAATPTSGAAAYRN